MFRPDKPLPPIPKGISDKFTSMMAKGPPPTLPNKPQQGRSQSPSKDTGFGASCVSQARAMFESSMKPSGSQQSGQPKQQQTSYASMALSMAKHVPVGTAVDMAKKIPTDTLVAAASASHPQYAKHVPLGTMIDAAKKVDTQTYVKGAEYANKASTAYSNSSWSDNTQPAPPAARPTSSSVSSLRNQLEGKLTIGSVAGGVPGTTPRPTYLPDDTPPPRAPPTSFTYVQSTSPTRKTPPSRPPPPQQSLDAQSPTEPYALVQYEFKAGAADELDMKSGDIIILRRAVDAEWMYGFNQSTRKYGIVPIGYLSIKRPLPSTAVSIASAHARSPPKVDVDSGRGSPLIGDGPRCQAVYAYTAQAQGDLTIAEGDVIRLLSRVGDEWLEGQLANGQKGVFPTSFVHIIEPLPTTHKTSPTQASKAPAIDTVTAMYDYTGSDAQDLTFKAGDVIEIVRYVSADWAHGRRVKQPNVEGMFPVSYVSKDTANQSQWVGRMVTALCDFRGETADQLWFSTGDKIKVIEEIDENWVKGQLQLDLSTNRNIPTGMFPKSFVQ